MCANISEIPPFITIASYPQAIAHVDCDAFFASCEAARNPHLKGKPLATGQERGIVSCPSYEAKAQGVVRGMRLGEARKACPALIVLPSDYELYSIYSERIFTILRRFTPEVEEYSIDEAFCDLTGLRRLYRGSYPDIARQIKETVQNELGITVSVGLSLSKTLAKLCSKQNKPNGFLACPGSKIHKLLPDIPLERVCGFGPNTVALLEKCGVHQVFDFINRPKEFAQRLLGKIGLELWLELRGISVYKVSSEKKEKYLSINKSKTFMPPSGDQDTVKAQLVRNLESACIKLRRHCLAARSLIVYLRKVDFTSTGAEGKISRYSSSTLDFAHLCSRLYQEIFEKSACYRATGVILADITCGCDIQTELFSDPVRIEQLRKISDVIDKINSNYGKHAIHLASGHIVGAKKEHARNCLSWRKQTLLKGETARRRLGIPLLKLASK